MRSQCRHVHVHAICVQKHALCMTIPVHVIHAMLHTDAHMRMLTDTTANTLEVEATTCMYVCMYVCTWGSCFCRVMSQPLHPEGCQAPRRCPWRPFCFTSSVSHKFSYVHTCKSGYCQNLHACKICICMLHGFRGQNFQLCVFKCEQHTQSKHACAMRWCDSKFMHTDIVSPCHEPFSSLHTCVCERHKIMYARKNNN
jgi:hypothetical protein